MIINYHETYVLIILIILIILTILIFHILRYFNKIEEFTTIYVSNAVAQSGKYGHTCLQCGDGQEPNEDKTGCKQIIIPVLYSCGYNRKGQLGLGNDAVRIRTSPGLIQKFYNTTSDINYDEITIIETSGGGLHNLFLTDAGHVYSCGDSSKGQLGLDNKDEKNIPTLIRWFNDTSTSLNHRINYDAIRIIEISAGEFHSLFLTEAGYVYSCGDSSDGQLGLHNKDDKNIPTLIRWFNDTSTSSYINYDAIRIIEISSCGYHSLFLTDVGHVYSCGNNEQGQLGLGNKDGEKNIPTPIESYNYMDSNNVKFNINSGNFNITQISAGKFHSLFLTNAGSVYSCGNNRQGQLGLGLGHNDLVEDVPTLIRWFNITQISAGGYHSLFLTEAGYVYSCGYNQQGQLGLGHTSEENFPRLIEKFYDTSTSTSSYINYDAIRIIEISAGMNHSLFLTNDGNVYSCGQNVFGQLGLGNKEPENRPTLIQSVNNIKKISCGMYHNLFLGFRQGTTNMEEEEEEEE